MNAAYLSDGAKLNYWDNGTGVPIIFLHPIPLDHEYWKPLAEKLVGVRAIVPDLRGHGESEAGVLTAGAFSLVPDALVLSVEQLAVDIQTLIKHVGVESALIAGCSIGGYVALELWRRIPEKIKGLIFVCSKPQPDIEAGKERRVTTIARARAGESAELFDGMAQSLVGRRAKREHPEIVAELRARMTLSVETLVAVQAGLAVRPDSQPTVATIHVPVLAIAGGEDGASTPTEMEAFQAAPGGCELHVLPDAGHFAAYEQPEAVAVQIAKWMKAKQF